jgi:hypothetical protein
LRHSVFYAAAGSGLGKYAGPAVVCTAFVCAADRRGVQRLVQLMVVTVRLCVHGAASFGSAVGCLLCASSTHMRGIVAMVCVSATVDRCVLHDLLVLM